MRYVQGIQPNLPVRTTCSHGLFIYRLTLHVHVSLGSAQLPTSFQQPRYMLGLKNAEKYLFMFSKTISLQIRGLYF